MSDPISFRPAAPTTALNSAGPKIAEHRSPAYKAANQALSELKSSNQTQTANIVATKEKFSDKLKNIARRIILKLTPASSELTQLPPQQRPILAAKQLIESFSNEDKNAQGVFRLSATHLFITDAKASISKGKMPEISKMNTTAKSHLLKELLGEAKLFDSQAIQRIQSEILSRLEDEGAARDINKTLTEIVANMPVDRQELLRDLLNLCDDIKSRSAENKMDQRNLALMIGPRLMPLDLDSAVPPTDQALEQEKLGTFLLSLDKSQRDVLFP